MLLSLTFLFCSGCYYGEDHDHRHYCCYYCLYHHYEYGCTLLPEGFYAAAISSNRYGHPATITGLRPAGSERCPTWATPAYSWNVPSLALKWHLDEPILQQARDESVVVVIGPNWCQLTDFLQQFLPKDMAFSRDALALTTHRCWHWAECLFPSLGGIDTEKSEKIGAF